jgi:hypothetical protein
VKVARTVWGPVMSRSSRALFKKAGVRRAALCMGNGSDPIRWDFVEFALLDEMLER